MLREHQQSRREGKSGEAHTVLEKWLENKKWLEKNLENNRGWVNWNYVQGGLVGTYIIGTSLFVGYLAGWHWFPRMVQITVPTVTPNPKGNHYDLGSTTISQPAFNWIAGGIGTGLTLCCSVGLYWIVLKKLQ